jgi:RsiW-degrading membrane proteinase PrsW (M82 family)
MGFVLSIFLGFIPMFCFAGLVYWLDRYEKEPAVLLGGIFIWGAVVAAGAAFLINTLVGSGVYLFTNSEAVTELTTGSLIAPIVEESLKGLAVLIVFLVFLNEFDSVLDGMIYAAITALGFAATENAYYIYNMGFREGQYPGLVAMAFIRIVLVGWQHPFYTSFIGIGLAISRLNRNIALKITVPIAGWCVAILVHSVHNTLAHLVSGFGGLIFSTIVDWTGWLVVFCVLLLAIRSEQRTLEIHLLEEVRLGTISPKQYKTASSQWAQWLARLGSLFAGRFQSTNRFYQLTAELAHKKNQLNRMGEERGNSQIISKLRDDVARLSPIADS